MMLAAGLAAATPGPAGDEYGRDCESYGIGDPQTDRFRTFLQGLVRDISAAVGRPAGFPLCEAPALITPAAADRNRRVLMYNPRTLAGMRQRNGRNEVAFVLVAHEMGHLMLPQRLSNDPRIISSNELEADEFAGFALRRLGLDLGIGSRAYPEFVPVDPREAGAPDRFDRIEAFERGYNQNAPPTATATPAPADEEDEDEPEPKLAERPAPAGDAAPAPAPSPWQRVKDFLQEGANLIVAIGGAIAALYGGYEWFRRRKRRSRTARAAASRRSGDPPGR